MKAQFVLVFFWILVSCSVQQESTNQVINPPAVGFNEEASDPKAIALADSVMNASGGRKAWDETKYLRWNFFGARRHTWNKHNGDLIIEGIRDSFLIHMNLQDMTGTVYMNDRFLTKQDSLDQYLEKAKEMWINDSYWIFLPYKLKDSGVTLSYLERDSTLDGQLAERIELQFDQVGVTPDNKYIVYVDPQTKRIVQWDFYRDATDEKARFSTPWTDYKGHGNLLLSASRGENYLLEDIAVGDSLVRYFDQFSRKSD